MPLRVNRTNSGGNDVGGAKRSQDGAYLRAARNFRAIQDESLKPEIVAKNMFDSHVENGRLVGQSVGNDFAFSSLSDLNSALGIELNHTNLGELEMRITRNKGKVEDAPCKLSGIDSPKTVKGWIDFIQSKNPNSN